jgi:hypothetical protein
MSPSQSNASEAEQNAPTDSPDQDIRGHGSRSGQNAGSDQAAGNGNGADQGGTGNGGTTGDGTGAGDTTGGTGDGGNGAGDTGIGGIGGLLGDGDIGQLLDAGNVLGDGNIGEIVNSANLGNLINAAGGELLGDGNIGQLLDAGNILGGGNIGDVVNPANVGNLIDGVLHTADSGVVRPVVNTVDGLLDGNVTNTTIGGGGLLAGTPLAGDGGFANANVMRADDSSSADLAQVGVGSDLTQSLINGSAGGGGLLAGTPLQSDGTAISANVLSEGNSSSSDLAQAGVGTDLSHSLIDVDAASDRGTSESNQIVDTDMGPQSGDSGVAADLLSDRNSSGALIDADAGQHQGPSLVDANVATAADQFQFPGLDGVGVDSLVGEVGQTVGSIDNGALDVLPVSAGVDGSVLLQVDASGQVDSGATGAEDGLHLMANTPLHGSLLGA